MAEAITYPLIVFYDGACAICSREMLRYQRQDRQGRLLLRDISQSDFRPENFGLDPSLIQQYLHVRDAVGRTVRGVEAFVWIWQTLGYRLLPSLFHLPILRELAKLGYKLFARYRYTLSGRKVKPACEGVCRWNGY